jgi:endo-1,4-beta-D-glucanase Y
MKSYVLCTLAGVVAATTAAGCGLLPGGDSTTSGGGGGSGGGGTGGVAAGCVPDAPSPPAGGANFPFPQHRMSSMCIYPAASCDTDVSSGWPKYITKFIVDGGSGTLRVQRTESSNDTVSEGIGYGMLIAVYMNDKATFDKLWQYGQNHFDGNHLMTWQWSSTGSALGSGSATDGDEDMGFALVMADKQWGGYTTAAQNFLSAMLAHDFNTDGSIKGGDANGFNDVNPSYIAPAYYKIFKTYTGNSQWTTAVDKNYSLLMSATNGTTGLVPEWSSGSHGTGNTQYLYNAARTPFRIALDACWFGETRATTWLGKIATFFNGIGATQLVDGYQVTGAPVGMYHTAPFFGPAGVSGMATNHQQLVDDAYVRVRNVAANANDNYYNTSWAVLSGLMMTGNFVNYTAP